MDHTLTLRYCCCIIALQAGQPTPEGVIELTLPAKTQHTQTLKVSNWLHKPQRFKWVTCAGFQELG
jgi:hypothetical protein